MFIEDGTGSGKKAGVDSDNRLSTSSITTTLLEWINEEEGQVFNCPLDGVAPSGATVFWVLQNNGQTTYAVSRILLASSVAGVFRLAKMTGTPGGGTVIASTSMNLSIASTLDNVALQSGTSITGLTEAGLLKPLYLAANQLLVLDIPSRIFLPPGAMVSLKAPGAAVVNGLIEIYKEMR